MSNKYKDGQRNGQFKTSGKGFLNNRICNSDYRNTMLLREDPKHRKAWHVYQSIFLN